MFRFILESTDASIEAFVFQTWGIIIEGIRAPLASLMIVFVALAGYLLWLGRIEISRSEIGTRLLQLVLVFVFVTHIDVLGRFFFQLSTSVPGAIGTQMVQALGTTGSDINQSIDQLYANGVQIGGQIWKNASVVDIPMLILGSAMILVVFIALVPIAFVLILAKVAVGVLLGLAPFAMLLYLFPSTRSLFQGYLQQLLSFALVPTMIYSLLGLLINMASVSSQALVDSASRGVPGFELIGPYVLILVSMALLSTQVLGWSSGIAGGLALSAAGAFSRPVAGFRGGLQVLQAGRRASSASGATTRSGRAAAFAGGAARQALGLRRPAPARIVGGPRP